MEAEKGRKLVGGELLKRSPCRHPGLFPLGPPRSCVGRDSGLVPLKARMLERLLSNTS